MTTEDAELVLAPEKGGCVSAFRWKGQNVLRPLDPSKGADAPPTDYAAFPLFPFSGRIANGQFSFDNDTYTLTPNFPPEPHAVHGNGWQSAWEVLERSSHSVHFFYENNDSDWPWNFRAEQGFAITQNGLRIDLQLTNLSDRIMPGGIGWHPYFPSGNAKLEADVSAVWLSGENMIPGSPTELTEETDLTHLRDVKDLRLDNAFSAGLRGTRILWEDQSKSVSMTASDPLRHLIVYTPEGEDFFCVEPVSHSPDALNSSQEPDTTGLQVLAPGESLTASISLMVEL